MTERPKHPYPAGTRVYHAGQQWHHPWMGGTAHVVEFMGPYSDGTYEYIVMAGEDISRQTGPLNRETRRAQWSQWATIAVEKNEFPSIWPNLPTDDRD